MRMSPHKSGFFRKKAPSRANPVRFVERSDGDGRSVLYALLFHEPTGLIVSVGQPESPLVSMFRNMRITLVVSMALILLLALAGSWVATNKITTPLQALNNSARRIAEGNPGENIEVDSRAAEFRVLAMSLNRMSAGFQRQINELQTLTQLQNEFIGIVGHEVRNPTFAVSGYLEALGSDSLTPEKRRRYAEKGLANLHRLQTLFSDLIEIARLEYREDLINPAPLRIVRTAPRNRRYPGFESKGKRNCISNWRILPSMYMPTGIASGRF